jgi:hypothetical protein
MDATDDEEEAAGSSPVSIGVVAKSRLLPALHAWHGSFNDGPAVAAAPADAGRVDDDGAAERAGEPRVDAVQLWIPGMDSVARDA